MAYAVASENAPVGNLTFFFRMLCLSLSLNQFVHIQMANANDEREPTRTILKI